MTRGMYEPIVPQVGHRAFTPTLHRRVFDGVEPFTRRRINMFETSVVRVQARAADRRLALLTLSIGAHAAIISAVIAASLTSVRMPESAPKQMTLPVFSAPPPALGNPEARPRQAPATPRTPQAPRVPVPQTVLAPLIIPSTVAPVPATGDAASNTTASDESEGPGVPWGSRDA